MKTLFQVARELGYHGHGWLTNTQTGKRKQYYLVDGGMRTLEAVAKYDGAFKLVPMAKQYAPEITAYALIKGEA